MEVRSTAKVMIIGMRCDECGVGMMKADQSVVLATNPPQFECTCDHCGATKVFYHPYPYHIIVGNEDWE